MVSKVAIVAKESKTGKKLKSKSVCGYSNDSNPFGDSNLKVRFVWRKKIERDLSQGVPLSMFSVKAEKQRQKERMAEIEKLKKRREERARKKEQHEKEMSILARERARVGFEDWEKKEEEFLLQQSKIRSRMASMAAVEEGFGSGSEVNLDSQKPRYFNRIHTGYNWNKYNQIHYDHDNPPPKFVQGYKFDIFYPDLIDKSKAPTYIIEKDENSDETCIIRFHAGPPYEDIAFRIVNEEWDYSQKKGFKCTFDGGILHVHFNFKCLRYRR